MSLHARKEGRRSQAVCADVPAGEELYRRREGKRTGDTLRPPRRVGEEPINLFGTLVVYKHRAVHERDARGAARRDHLFYFLRIYTHRLFDEDVLARRCRFRHPLLVQFCWQRDVDRIHTFVREERVVALDPTDGWLQLQLVAESIRLRQLARCDGD